MNRNNLKHVLVFLLTSAAHLEPVLGCISTTVVSSASPFAPSPGGNSPPQNQLPPVPAASTSNTCGHSKYYYSSSNPNPGSARIVGGITAAPNEYPWLARLKISLGDGTSDLCGASLINSNWLITAAHCAAAAINASYITAVFGDWDKQAPDTGEYSVTMSRIHIHSQYSSSSNDYDFALLKLSGSVSLTNDWVTQAICLPSSCSDGCGTGTIAYITGWGTTAESRNNFNHSNSASRYQQKAYVNIIDKTTCYNNYLAGMGTRLTDRMMCAGYANGGVDTCLGDSGGPLMVAENGFYKLCGVTSFGNGCARVGYYGVYSQVCKVVDWIADTVARN